LKKIIILSVSVIFFACQPNEAKKEKHATRQKIKRHDKNISERMLRIDGKDDTLRSYEVGENLFGKFFKNRAEFYVIANPNKTLYSQPVRSITLYFLDGRLAKTKYTLDEDISDHLIETYGNFSIKAYDSITRTLFNTEKVLLNVDHKKVLNKNLKNYHLRWERDTKYIFVRVDKRKPKKTIEYIETLKDFHSTYKNVEAAW
jgi:hypothetical protein